MYMVVILHVEGSLAESPGLHFSPAIVFYICNQHNSDSVNYLSVMLDQDMSGTTLGMSVLNKC